MSHEFELAQSAVEAALSAGASYADARVGRISREELCLRNGQMGSADALEDCGIGVRVLVGGASGFAAAPLAWRAGERIPREHTALSLAERAVLVARSLARARRTPIVFARTTPAQAEYTTPCAIDPFALPLSEKIELLRRTESSLAGASETVVREASLSFRRSEQWFASSDGARVYQHLVRTGAGLSTTAAAHGEVQRRSYPASFGGNYQAGGFERALALDLPAHGPRLRDESVALCAADPCPAGRRALILLGSQLMLQIHESVGHASELDRACGHEVDLAGSSFATPDALGRLRFGSPIVNLVADSTVAGGLDTRGFDDDGVRSQRWHVVRDGMFVGYHTSREWSARIGEPESRGAARAESWFHPPIVRITNLSLEPGRWTLEQLIADTEDGVLCDVSKMWSIDQRRLNFQFTTEIGFEIKDGKLGRMLRDPTYQDSTPRFWGACDAICDADHMELWGVSNCGKGNPIQLAEMSHGASPARFRDVAFVR
jgi:TldD protein